MFEVDGMVRSRRRHAPSNLSITGRYILQPEIFKILETQERGAAARSSSRRMIGLAKTQGFYGVEFEGERMIALQGRLLRQHRLRMAARICATACARDEALPGEVRDRRGTSVWIPGLKRRQHAAMS